MSGKYLVSVFSLADYLDEVKSFLEKSLKNADLSDKVEVIDSAIHLIDYGINPDADSDCRTYFRVRDSHGKEIFQKYDVLIKTCHRDIQYYINRAINALQNHVNLAV